MNISDVGVRICGGTAVGRVRPHNEDAFLIGGILENRGTVYLEMGPRSSYVSTRGLFACVADGVGGNRAGEVASALVLTVLAQKAASTDVRPQEAGDITILLRDWIVAANDEILKAADNNPDFRGMGTTLAGIWLLGEKLCVVNVGDSRVYRLRHGGLAQLTKDHTLVQLLIDSGHISREQAMVSRDKHIITGCVGTRGTVTVDVTDRYTLFPDDTMLVCTDGLSEMVDDKIIADILSEKVGIREKVSTFLEAANKAGGKDNVTVIIVEAYTQTPEPEVL